MSVPAPNNANDKNQPFGADAVWRQGEGQTTWDQETDPNSIEDDIVVVGVNTQVCHTCLPNASHDHADLTSHC